MPVFSNKSEYHNIIGNSYVIFDNIEVILSTLGRCNGVDINNVTLFKLYLRKIPHSLTDFY